MRHLIVLCCSICLLLAACGGEGEETAQRPDAVIRVGDVEFTRAAVIKTVSDLWPVGDIYGGRKLKPPRYSACLRVRLTKTKRQLAFAKRYCRELYESHEQFAVGHLIQDAWVRLEARARGIEPTRAELERLYQRQLRSLPSAAVRRARHSDRARQAILQFVRVNERNRRLAKALKTTPDQLNQTLARLYRDRTHCARRYRVGGYPECTGTLPAQ